MKGHNYVLFFFFVTTTKIVTGQSPASSPPFQIENKTIDSKLLTGFWESTDSLKQKIEFVDLKNEMIIKQENGSHSYTFQKDSLNQVFVSGFIANWPPSDCELNLINTDTLQIDYSQMGTTHSVLKYKRLMYKN